MGDDERPNICVSDAHKDNPIACTYNHNDEWVDDDGDDHSDHKCANCSERFDSCIGLCWGYCEDCAMGLNYYDRDEDGDKHPRCSGCDHCPFFLENNGHDSDCPEASDDEEDDTQHENRRFRVKLLTIEVDYDIPEGVELNDEMRNGLVYAACMKVASRPWGEQHTFALDITEVKKEGG